MRASHRVLGLGFSGLGLPRSCDATSVVPSERSRRSTIRAVPGCSDNGDESLHHAKALKAPMSPAPQSYQINERFGEYYAERRLHNAV